MPLTDLELQALNAEYEGASPQDMLRWAASTFGDKLAVVTSFQPTGIVTLHMLSEIAPHTAVLTLDTELLFPETYTLIETMQQRLNLNLVRVRPALTLAEQAEKHGPALWERDPDLCCQIRKVAPLGPALAPYDAWITGLRRDQNGRGHTPIIAWDKKYQKVKVCPFADWTEEMLWTYIHAYELPYNALHDQNYPTIGCHTSVCTQPVYEGQNERAGRWVNSAKTECGLHTKVEEHTQK